MSVLCLADPSWLLCSVLSLVLPANIDSVAVVAWNGCSGATSSTLKCLAAAAAAMLPASFLVLVMVHLLLWKTGRVAVLCVGFWFDFLVQVILQHWPTKLIVQESCACVSSA